MSTVDVARGHPQTGKPPRSTPGTLHPLPQIERRGHLVLDRRAFLRGGSAFVVGVALLSASDAAAKSTAAPSSENLATLFVSITADETVTLTCHRSEMGQQVWTSMAQLLVEELEVRWDQVVIEQAEGDRRYGDQNTDGSRSVRYNFDRLRQAGALMRTQLVRAAATTWKVKPNACSAKDGRVTHVKSGRTLSYGSLVESAATLSWPALPSVSALKPRSEWTAIGKPLPSRTVPQIVRGEGTFGQDVRWPGMKIAVIARPPTVLGTVRSVDDRRALAVSGVERVFTLPPLTTPWGFKPLGGVAVIAKDTWAALKGRKALDVAWDLGPNTVYDSDAFEKTLRETARRPGTQRRNRGDVDAALTNASQTLEADYFVPHLAHCAMEPPAVVAAWDGDRVRLLGCGQTPQAARRTVAEVCGIPEDNVTVNVTWLGGGFGRKSKPDHFVEAALVAREAGAPVKVVWTREDDLQHGYFHTVSAQHFSGGLDDSGRCTAFLHRTVFPPIGSMRDITTQSPSWGDMRQGATDTPFDVENLRVESGEAPAHLRIGWLRSVANIYHAFGVQSFAAELAHAAKRDPKDYLLELIGPPRRVDPNAEGAQYDNYGSPLTEYPIDTGRMATVVRTVAEMSQWSTPRPFGHGLGIAVHRSFLTYVATVVEVVVDAGGQLEIAGVWSAMDAGTVVNPNHAANQLEGGTLFGLSNALYGEITARGGVVSQSNFPAWRVMRMNESPRVVEVKLIASDAPPGGVGEPATPPAAPALANAIFAATGERIRRLPIFGADRHRRLTPPRPGVSQ